MVIEQFTRENLCKLLYNNYTGNFIIPDVVNTYGCSSFVNFKYFSPENLSDIFAEKENMFIVAYEEGQISKVYGVIDYGWYYNRLAVSYIDVNSAYKRRGIAKQLIEALNCELHRNNISDLCLSTLSREGRNSHIDEVFRRMMPDIHLSIGN